MFKDRLKLLRTSNKFTQQDLADKLEVSQRTIAFYEKGERHPDYESLLKLADIFECSVDYLLGRTNNPNEVLRKPNPDEALVVLAKNANIPEKMLKEYIEYLRGLQSKSD